MRKARMVALVLAAAVALVGCTGTPTTTPTPSPTQRVFTMMTAQHLTVTDPAAVTSDTDSMVALVVFQRLMAVFPGKAELKPALATDCLFRGETVYECTIPKDMKFSNGHALTSSDVKFSIERAFRLGVPGTALSLMDSLDTIETPDPTTVRFNLKWNDSLFGYALATPAASIVDEEVYDPDVIRPVDQLPVGSGPFKLTSVTDSGVTLTRFDTETNMYKDSLPAIQITYAGDSAAAEQAINDGTVDLVWRTLDEPALSRLSGEIAAASDHRTKKGFVRVPMIRTRVQTLRWTDTSRYWSDAVMRTAVASALQSDRTLASLMPTTVPGYVAAFKVGGTATIQRPTSTRVKLILSYSSTSPGAADIARTIRDRVENRVGVSVQLKEDAETADLVLADNQPWFNTPLAWMQSYLDTPLPGSAAKLTELELRVRTTLDQTARDVALAEIQKQAAVDATVLPISQSDGILMTGKGVYLAGESFGPGWQLGLWGLRRE